ncbi:MAG: hypothetical protein J6Y24_06585 [Bacteroidales bacterium]|nr:hypothetical protein [Bacteroidales bacterium]
MKHLVFCLTILLGSFIVRGQSSDYAQLTFKVKAEQEFENGTHKQKRAIYQNTYVIISSNLFVVSNTKNHWDLMESAIVAKFLDSSFDEETGMLMMRVEDIRSNLEFTVVFLADKNSVFIQLPTGKAVAYDVERVENEF